MDMLTQQRCMTKMCVGCGACLGLCPTNAISIKTNNALTVNFDYSRCIKCNLCIEACPALSNYYRENPAINDVLGKIEKIFFGYSTDNSIRYHAASGGVITSLVLYMLKQKIVDKALVTKMDGFTANPILTDNEEDVVSAQGSIYFKTFSLRILKKLLFKLKKGKRICIVGLPCQISTLKKVMRDFEDKLYFIGLICNHVNENWYLRHIIKKYLPKNAKPIAIGPRKDGWPGEIRILFKLNNNFKETAVSPPKFWGTLPSLNISSPLGCLLCVDHLASAADIVVGDAWHPKFTGKNSSGVSILIARTPRGLRLMEESIRDEVLYAEEAGLRDLLIAQGFHLIEGIYYASLRQKLLQYRISIIRDLKDIDKIIVLLLAIITTHLLKFKIIRQLLDASPTEKALRLVSWFLSRQKYRKLSQTASSLNNPSLVTSAR
jgi:coenzyme F420 hydrogenase subunit beta